MSMSVEAMNALTGIVNDSARTGIASYQASVDDEDRRRKALLARYEMERGYGDRADDIRQQLANGQDMAGQLKTLFGMNKQSANTGATVSGIQDITSQPQGTSAVDKLLARVKGKNSYDIAKANVLEEAGGRNVDTMMQAYMVADAEERAKTGNRLDINTFKSRYQDAITQNQPQPGVNDLGNVAMDNSAERDRLRNEVVQQTNIAEEQKMIDAENKKRDSLNMATAKQIKAEQAAASKNVDPIDILNNAGVQLPANGEWHGTFADQTGHAQQVFGSLVDHYASKGDYKTAEKYQREYDANMTSIYKKFGEKWDRKSNRLFEVPKSGGGFGSGKPMKLTLTGVSATKDEFGNRVSDTRDVVVPADVAMSIGTPQARKWLKDKYGFTDTFLQGDIRINSGDSMNKAGKQIGEDRAYSDIVVGLQNNDPQYLAMYARDDKGNIVSREDGAIAFYNPETKKLQQKVAALDE